MKLCWHRYKIRAVQNVEYYDGIVNRPNAIPTKRTTKVAKVCAKCSKIKVKEITGTWTLEELSD